MDNKILEILLDMQKEIKDMKSEMKDMKSEMKDINTKIDRLEYKMTDGFETLELLTENNIPFIQEKKFDSCISPKGNPLRFDFYVNNKYLIEYDG